MRAAAYGHVKGHPFASALDLHAPRRRQRFDYIFFVRGRAVWRYDLTNRTAIRVNDQAMHARLGDVAAFKDIVVLATGGVLALDLSRDMDRGWQAGWRISLSDSDIGNVKDD